MKNFLLAVVALFSFQTIAFSQTNLIPNGSFENIARIPEERGQAYLARPWSSTAASRGIPADIFHKRARYQDLQTPLNYVGEQEPHSGEGYVGINVLRGGESDYREFLQVMLMEPLQKGELYELEFYTSLAEYSEIATSSLGFYFSQRPPLLIENGFLMAKPQVQVAEENIITEKKNWVRIVGQFKAAGGEIMVTVGNFKSRENAPQIKVEPIGKLPVREKTWKEKVANRFKETDETFSYYYLDDIKLTKVTDKQPEVIARVPEPEPKPKPAPEPVKKPEVVVAKRSDYFGDVAVKKTIRLDKIFFQPDKYVLLPTSYEELNKLHGFLTENPTVSIQINGHTDITNLPDYNQVLSENRAKAVKTYLIRKGISEKRIKTKGFGETQPVATNETEEGKQQNRRVEFEILP